MKLGDDAKGSAVKHTHTGGGWAGRQPVPQMADTNPQNRSWSGFRDETGPDEAGAGSSR